MITGRLDSILGQFGQMGHRVKGQFVITGHIAIWFDCRLLAVLCCHLATENVMKWMFLAFCYTSQHGGGAGFVVLRTTAWLYVQILATDANNDQSNRRKLRWGLTQILTVSSFIAFQIQQTVAIPELRATRWTLWNGCRLTMAYQHKSSWQYRTWWSRSTRWTDEAFST